MVKIYIEIHLSLRLLSTLRQPSYVRFGFYEDRYGLVLTYSLMLRNTRRRCFEMVFRNYRLQLVIGECTHEYYLLQMLMMEFNFMAYNFSQKKTTI